MKVAGELAAETRIKIKLKSNLELQKGKVRANDISTTLKMKDSKVEIWLVTLKQ